MSVTFSTVADDDLQRVYIGGVESFGVAQAERYVAGLRDACRLIGDFPRLARLRTEIAPPIRAHPYRSHVIVYDIAEDEHVLIQRIRHGREDWSSDPIGG